MDKNKLGTLETIALIFTVMINHTILTLSRDIVSSIKTSAILNVLFVGIIAIFIGFIIYKLLKKFPGLDILDISNFLGGKILKTIIGILFFVYFSFTAAILLNQFSHTLQIIYYPLTNIFFIILTFIIAICIVSCLNFNSVIRTNLLILPIVLISMFFLFIANSKNFDLNRIYPILGDGINSTFLAGSSNLFAFGGLSLLYFLPPHLKDSTKYKKITLISILLSLIYLLLNISSTLLMFDTFVETDELMPLYSAVRYIEFGTFFQRLDSIFLLIWIISFSCYLSIIMNFCIDIFKKLTNIKNSKFVVMPLGLLLVGISLIPNNIAMSNFWGSIIYKYAFFILVLGISIPVLILANLKNNLKLSKQ